MTYYQRTYPHMLDPISSCLYLRLHTLHSLPLQLHNTFRDIQGLMLQQRHDRPTVQTRAWSIDEEHVWEAVDGHRHVSFCVGFPAIVELDVVSSNDVKGVSE